MRRLKSLIALFVAAIIPLGGLIAAAPAMAYNIRAVYKDCANNGVLTGHYSRAELQAALNNIPSQVAEYSTCQVLIQQALLKASSPGGRGHHPGANNTVGAGGSHHGGGGSGNGSTRHHKGKADKSGTRRGQAGKGTSTSAVTPTAANIRPDSTGTGSSSSVPVALIVVLVLLALTAVSGGIVAIRRRVDAGPGT